jgi:hypothetical protein
VPVRRFVACLVAMLASTVPVDDAAALSAFDTSLPSAESSDRAVVDRLVFEVPLTRFRLERSRAKRAHRWLITSTDGCSAPLVGSTGRSFDFRLACERHDLAYANYAALARVDVAVKWDAALRAKVDDQFQRDLQDSCLRRRHSERLRCDAWVVVFFHAVRVAAGP